MRFHSYDCSTWSNLVQVMTTIGVSSSSVYLIAVSDLALYNL